MGVEAVLVCLRVFASVKLLDKIFLFISTVKICDSLPLEVDYTFNLPVRKNFTCNSFDLKCAEVVK